MNKTGMRTVQPLVLPAIAGLVLALVGGCAGHKKKTDAILQSYRAGQMDAALAQVEEAVADSNEKDELIWLLEAGAVARAAGDYELSNDYFDRADAIYSDYRMEAEVSLSDEAAATITNQAELPYRGRTYDGIMLNTYKALNYMALGEPEAARVELNRAYHRQREAVAANAARIEKAREEAEEEGYNVEEAKQDPKLSSQLEAEYGELLQERAEGEFAAYTNYVNPFSEFVQAVFFASAAQDASDLERARLSMERVGAMAAHNRYLAEDVALWSQIANGRPVPPLTYVLFETGTAPHRTTIRIDIPLFVLGKYSGGVDYAGAAFPKLKDNDQHLHPLNVTGPGGGRPTAVLASMDRVIKQDFKNEFPVILTKTLVSTAVKATAAWGLNQATKGSGLVNVLTRVGTSAYQVANNRADERTWRTLPKQFEYTRFPTPDNGMIGIYDPNTGDEYPVELNSEGVNVVWVKSTSTTVPLQVSHFTLP